LKGDIYYGENLANMGQSSAAAAVVILGATFIPDRAHWNGTSIVDAETLGFALVAGFRVNDMLVFEAGYGQANNEIEDAGVKFQNNVRSYYLNATINLAKNVFIVPEVGVLDYGDVEVTGAADVDQGDMKYFGAKWQINF
jgi:hypothetical protein